MWIILITVIVIGLGLAAVGYENDQGNRKQEGRAHQKRQKFVATYGPHACRYIEEPRCRAINIYRPAKNCACYWDSPYSPGEGRRLPVAGR
jgi:hypothetical protein